MLHLTVLPSNIPFLGVKTVPGTLKLTVQNGSRFPKVLEFTYTESPGQAFPTVTAFLPGSQPPARYTCVGDTVLLPLPPGLVDDAHPDQGRQDHAAHHSDSEDAHSSPILPATRAGQHTQLAVRPLSAQGIGHLAGVPACILGPNVLHNE